MKKRSKYIFVILVFILIMSFILIFFDIKNNNIILKNKTNNMLEYIYKLNVGNYSYKNGYIFNNKDYIVSEDYNIDGNGYIKIDKYGNVELLIDLKNKCISKTSLGNINIYDDKCNKFNKIDVQFIKNNNSLSFITNLNYNEYKISTNDDFKGTWIKNNNSNLVLKSYNEGTNYIWFKDSKGNISDVIKFNVECLNTKDAIYDKNVFYCSGSSLVLNNNKYIVIKDTYDKIVLLRERSINIQMSHCIMNDNKCLFTDKSQTYNWKNSYVNEYLNEKYIYNLDNKIIDKVIEEDVCIDNLSFCNNEKCIGYTKDEIKNNGYECNQYTKSKIRLLTYDEFNYMYNKFDNNILGNNYWILNSFLDNKGSVIDGNNDVFINEELHLNNNIKPVITLSKLD